MRIWVRIESVGSEKYNDGAMWEQKKNLNSGCNYRACQEISIELVIEFICFFIYRSNYCFGKYYNSYVVFMMRRAF